ncbi:glycosyltransferase family 2 protein [Candidatus Saccharibacteria bacterium]|nr:glycosyltransferase family 2 protein [Candidatus Saccharibacteria bacterium]
MNIHEIKTHNKHVWRPKIVGLIRERNEALILQDTLDELAKIADAIVVFDDASEDDSVKIALNHPKVVKILANQTWNSDVDRSKDETLQRGALLQAGMKYHPKWILYQDADERFEKPEKVREFMLNNAKNPKVSSITFTFYDAYMTKKDQEPYTGGKLYGFRKMFGVERREIPMAWKPNKDIRYPEDIPDLRVPVGIDPKKAVKKFFVQHYGKSLSVDQWEETCDYYIEHFPGYAEKWKKRKGKGIHSTKSDFGTKLLTWEEVKKNKDVLIG